MEVAVECVAASGEDHSQEHAATIDIVRQRWARKKLKQQQQKKMISLLLLDPRWFGFDDDSVRSLLRLESTEEVVEVAEAGGPHAPHRTSKDTHTSKALMKSDSSPVAATSTRETRIYGKMPELARRRHRFAAFVVFVLLARLGP